MDITVQGMMQASSFIRDFRQRKKEIYLMKEKNVKIKRMIEFIVFLLISCILFEKVTWIFRSNGEEAKIRAMLMLYYMEEVIF